MTSQELLKRSVDELRATREEVLALFDLPEEQLKKAIKPGAWSVRFLLHHMADREMIMANRVCRAMSEPGSAVHEFAPNAWARHLDYSKRPLAISKALFQANRDLANHLFSVMDECYWDMMVDHESAGPLTVADMAISWSTHTRHHLEQIQAALDGDYSEA